MSLIHDTTLVQDFFSSLIPQLERDEVMLMYGQTRKKYFVSKSEGHDGVIARQILRKPDKVLGKVQKLSTLVTSSIDFKTGKSYDPSTQVLYYHLNPKSTIKAFSNTMKLFQDHIYEAIQGDESRYRQLRKVDVHYLTELHKVPSRRLYSVIDIDAKDFDLLGSVSSLFARNDIAWVTETHGGFHVILNKSKEVGKTLYELKTGKLMMKEDLKDVEFPDSNKREPMTVICGTIQGGFKTKMIEL